MNRTEPRPGTASERTEKHRRLETLLDEQKLDAVVIARHENIAWLTAGAVDIRVGLLRETGPAALLVTRGGGNYYLTTANEAARLAEEEFAGLGYTPVVRPWTDADVEGAVRSVVPAGRVGADAPLGSFTAVNLQPLRLLLTADEMDRYRWLGAQMAEVATEELRALEPGMRERTMQARLAAALLARGLTPSVSLCAVDARVLRYAHPVPREGVLRRLAMLCFCARYGGLAASMTRFVHFGDVPADLAEGFHTVEQVNARIQSATHAGATAAELFAVLREAYADAGCAGGERAHHQGGAAGYLEREWFARPGGAERLEANQAFAWNPTYRGAKVEDTRLLCGDARETLTRTPGLPEVVTRLNGEEHRSAGVLIR